MVKTADVAASNLEGARGFRQLSGLTRQALGLGWRSSRFLCLSAVAAQAAASLAPAAAAWASKELVDGLNDGGAGRRLMFLGGAVVLAGGLGTLVGYAANLATSAQQRAIGLQVEEDLYRAINASPGLRYFESPNFQDQLRLAQQSSSAAPGAVFGFVLAAVRTISTLAGFLGVLLLVWWPMALLLAVTAIPTVFSQIALTRRQAGTAEATIGLHRRRFAYQSLLSNPAAIKEVRLFGLGDLFRQRMTEGLRETTARDLAVERHATLTQSGFAFASLVAGAVGAMIVVARAAQGAATAGDVILFVAAIVGVQSAFSGTITQFGSMIKSVRLFHHFQAIVHTPADLADGELDPGALTGEIRFSDVWFRYRDGSGDAKDDWVLRGLNLTIPAGQALALAGLNGAGKSTLIKLLCRFYDPERGQITWDGVDLRTCSVQHLRRRIGAAFQDFQTYELSAAENIGVGDVTHLDDRPRIAAAADLAEASPVIEALPHGYDTLISRIFVHGESGEAGVALSGGEGQRVALARSLMRSDADLLILDEPTAGMDAVAESHVHATLRAHREGRTSLLVSHRLNTLRDADAIAVLERGQVVELGTHDELMTANGTYALMFGLQAAGYQDDRVIATPATSFDLQEAVLKAKATGGPVRIMSMSSRPGTNSGH